MGGEDVPGPVELLDPDIEYVNPEGASSRDAPRIAEFTDAAQKIARRLGVLAGRA